MQDKNIPYILVAIIFSLIFLIYFLYHIQILSIPFLISIFLVYFLDPLVSRASRRILSRGLASLIFLILFFLLIGFILYLFIPKLIIQFQSLLNGLPSYFDYLFSKLKDFVSKLKIQNPKLVEEIENQLLTDMKANLPLFINKLSPFLSYFFENIYNFFVGLSYIILIPIFSFYLLKDFVNIKTKIKNLIPVKFRDDTIKYLKEIDLVISSFIRGQITVSIILSILFSVSLTILGVPFSIFIGFLSGFGDIIPYFGTFLGIALSLIVSFSSGVSLKIILGIFLVYALIKGFEHFFLSPKIFGKEIKVHPVIIIISIIIFGKLMGIFGMLIAVPLTAVIKVILKNLYSLYINSEVFAQK
ncbi:MAG: AI-2E family transporter [Acidobacteriota bacterium]